MPITKRGKKWVVSIGSGRDRIRSSFNTEAEAQQYEVEVIMKRLGATQKSTSSSGGTTLGMLKILTAKNLGSTPRKSVDWCSILLTKVTQAGQSIGRCLHCR